MEKLEDSSILVSIVVISYNSEKYIRETLDSCVSQEYENIEVIISDDGSSDATVRECKNWIEKNNPVFRVAIIESKINTGITKNCNRGLKNAKGEWIKFIAADDLLLSNCISDLLRQAAELNDERVCVVFSKFQTFDSAKNHGESYPDTFTRSVIKMRNPYWQAIAMLTYFGNAAPSAFINRKILCLMGGFDESYFLLEDLPLWHKLIANGYIFSWLDKTTVEYRMHEGQATGSSMSSVLAADLTRFNRLIRIKYGFLGRVIFVHHALQIFSDKSRMKFPRSLTLLIKALSPIKLLVYIVNNKSGR